MRRGVVLVLFAGLLGGLPAPTASASAGQVVEYRGLRFTVPKGWPVYRLDQRPHTCVRFDVNAVYLGRPGEDQDCPARLVGRTEAVLVQPLGNQALDTPDSPAPPEITHEVRARLTSLRLLVTVSYGDREDIVHEVLGRHRREAVPDPPQEPPVRLPPDGQAWRRTKMAGQAFDTCATPSLRTMRAWRRAFQVANIYIGGASRACGYGNLSRDWLWQARRLGWRFIPSYVGLQAPCNRYRAQIDPARAFPQGRWSADDAINRAYRLGLPRGVPIYFDIEGYNSSKGWCRRAVLRFLSGWTTRLHERGYASGVYSSVSTGIRDLGKYYWAIKPDTVWFAHWDRRNTVWNDPYLPNSWWRNRQRIKQYMGPHKERHGGIRMNIDRNVVDGDVA